VSLVPQAVIRARCASSLSSCFRFIERPCVNVGLDDLLMLCREILLKWTMCHMPCKQLFLSRFDLLHALREWDQFYRCTCLYFYPDKLTSTLFYQGASTCTQNLPTTCPAGQYMSSGNCMECAAGTYSSAGSTSCTMCPADTFSDHGASSCTNCQSGSGCPKVRPPIFTRPNS
jgi:hypothetical protein